MGTAVRTFRGPFNDMEAQINQWAMEAQVRILNTSMCYDDKTTIPGIVFVMVVYQYGG